MGKGVLIHTAMTVGDIDAIAGFYGKYFGFRLEPLGELDADFIASLPALYAQKPGVSAGHANLVDDESGQVIELFSFSDMQEKREVAWNQPGYQHLCIKVESVPEFYEKMKADGVPFSMEPAPLGEPNQYWTFFRDPEGNLVELQD